MSQEDYERGVKHGNEGKYAHPSSIIDHLGGKDYVAGKDFAYNQRTDKSNSLDFFLSGKESTNEEFNKPDTDPSSDGSSPGSSSGGSGYSSGYSGGGGHSKTSPWAIFAIIGVVVIFIFIVWQCSNNAFNEDIRKRAEYDRMASQREAEDQRVNAEKARIIREDLPAGLKVTDKNYLETGDSTIGPHIVANKPPEPGTVFHVYTKRPGQEWAEEEITNTYTQNMSDGTFRTVLNTKNITTTMGGGRIVIVWEHQTPEALPAVKENDSTENVVSEGNDQQTYNEFSVELSNLPPHSKITLVRAEITLPSGESKPARVSNIELRGTTMIVRTADFYPAGSRINCQWNFQPLVKNFQPRRFIIPPRAMVIPHNNRRRF